MRRNGCLALLFLLASSAFAQDPLETDGDKYTLLFENDRVSLPTVTNRATGPTSITTPPSCCTH